MNVGSLFAGIGGFDLGFERAGMHTAWQVELDPYCRAVLAKHFPDAERFEDVREVGAHNLAPVDLICGGFPCQDLSVAGKGAGIDGERSGLWAEFARIIRELEPRYVVIENVPALLSPPFGPPRGCVCGGADRGRGFANDHEEQQGILLGSDRGRDDEARPPDPSLDGETLWRQGLEIAKGYGEMGRGMALATHRQGGGSVRGSDPPAALRQGRSGGLADGTRESASAVSGGRRPEGENPRTQQEGSRCRACGGAVGHPPGKPPAGVSRVLGDLAALGYDAEWDCLSAAAFGAPHRRDRIWIVAYPSGNQLREQSGRRGGKGRPDPPIARIDGPQGTLADADSQAGNSARATGEALPRPEALERSRRCGRREPQGTGVVPDADGEQHQGAPHALGQSSGEELWHHWATEPDVDRVADGVPSRMDRLSALGNALVPQIAEWIGHRILDFERGGVAR
jgi:site-specific DNA-cytosine methylase